LPDLAARQDELAEKPPARHRARVPNAARPTRLGLHMHEFDRVLSEDGPDPRLGTELSDAFGRAHKRDKEPRLAVAVLVAAIDRRFRVGEFLAARRA
jgi:hypothetical protein